MQAAFTRKAGRLASQGNLTSSSDQGENTGRDPRGQPRDFPGGPVVRIPRFYCSGEYVQSLVKELRSYMPCSKKKKKKKEFFFKKKATHRLRADGSSLKPGQC